MRHYINLRILWATLTEFQTIGPFGVDWEAQQYKGRLSQVITFGLLATLQSINLFWLFLILRIAIRIVIDDVKEDVRSEGEESDEEEPVKEAQAITASGTDNVPKVQLNGKAMNANLSREASQEKQTTPRREGLRQR